MTDETPKTGDYCESEFFLKKTDPRTRIANQTLTTPAPSLNELAQRASMNEFVHFLTSFTTFRKECVKQYLVESEEADERKLVQCSLSFLNNHGNLFTLPFIPVYRDLSLVHMSQYLQMILKFLGTAILLTGALLNYLQIELP